MMAKNKTKCSDIERNALNNLEFLSDDILLYVDERNSRQKKLQEATFLGNLEEKKVMIEFVSNKGCHVIHTTLWAFTSDWVVFKESQRIPTRSIRKVYF